jgi:hypothetical protein
MGYRQMTVRADQVRKGDVLTHPDVYGAEVIGIGSLPGMPLMLYLSTGDSCWVDPGQDVNIARW